MEYCEIGPYYNDISVTVQIVDDEGTVIGTAPEGWGAGYVQADCSIGAGTVPGEPQFVEYRFPEQSEGEGGGEA